MFDPQRLLGQLLGQATGGGFRGKRGRGIGSMVGKAQLGVGLLGIAMAAWEHYQGQQKAAPVMGGSAPPPPPMRSSNPPPPPSAAVAAAVLTPAQQDAMNVIRVMIAAAQADGSIDAEERDAILGRARDGGLDAESLAVLERELATPVDLDRLLATSRDALAPDFYAAALVAIRVDTPAERAWLDSLAQRTGLDDAARTAIRQRLGLA